MMKSQNKCYFVLVFAISLLLNIASSRQEDIESKRSAHNILRFGRSGPLYPYRVGRAGHNIMRFGRSDKSLSLNGGEMEGAGDQGNEASYQTLTIGDLEALNELPDLLLNGYANSKRNKNNFIHFG